MELHRDKAFRKFVRSSEQKVDGSTKEMPASIIIGCIILGYGGGYLTWSFPLGFITRRHHLLTERPPISTTFALFAPTSNTPCIIRIPTKASIPESRLFGTLVWHARIAGETLQCACKAHACEQQPRHTRIQVRLLR